MSSDISKQELKNADRASLQKTERTDAGLVHSLQELINKPTTTGILEFITGLAVTTVSNQAGLILSGGHLAQALAKGTLYKQLYDEVQKYRRLGKLPDEKLNSGSGFTLFVELLSTIDNEALHKDRFDALKSIFFRSVRPGSNEHEQMQAYQYFQACKKLSSLDILVLKDAYEIYKNDPDSNNLVAAGKWEMTVSQRLRLPYELVQRSRIENSNASQNPKAVLFDYRSERNTMISHGLSALGIEIARFIEEGKLKS